LFIFDNATPQTDTTPVIWWKITLGILGFILVIGSLIYFIDRWVKKDGARKAKIALILNIVYIVCFGYLTVFAIYEIFFKHVFHPDAMYLWILGVGAFLYYELNVRDYKFILGKKWQISLIGFFIVMAIFATVYYPHIMAKWEVVKSSQLN
jgi:hypothetical protein